MKRNILLLFLTLMLAVTLAGAANAADLGTLTVTFKDGSQVTDTGSRYGNSQNGAIHYYVYDNSRVQSAQLVINGQTITWNGKNGAENKYVPWGYRTAVWHWVYTPSGKLTISDVTGVCRWYWWCC